MPSIPATRSASNQPLESVRQRNRPHSDEIAVRAYELYKNRGEIHGHDLDDWFQAELQLIREREVSIKRA